MMTLIATKQAVKDNSFNLGQNVTYNILQKPSSLGFPESFPLISN